MHFNDGWLWLVTTALNAFTESSRMAGKVTSGYFIMWKLLDAILSCIYAELKLSSMTVAGTSASMDFMHSDLVG